MDYDKHTVFPLSLFKETVEILNRRNATFLCYRDLNFSGKFNSSRLNYLGEYVRFKKGRIDPILILLSVLGRCAMRGRPPFMRSFNSLLNRDKAPPTILLQHDADRQPYKTIDLMNMEKELGMRSSNYFFYESSYSDEKDYKLDIEVLQSLEQDGFEIGYHQNAYELGCHDLNRAFKIVSRDVQWFRRYFRLSSFVPHAVQNRLAPHDGELKDLIWAYNGRGVLTDFSWSDGGTEKYATPSDPREFASFLPDGCRAGMLFHPQYYGFSLCRNWESLPISKMTWWKKLWGF